jgi:hypothetical protein
MSLDKRVAFVHALVTNPFVTAQAVSVDGGMHSR